MITILGATGQVGYRVAERLLKEGEQVRAIGRNTDRLDALAAGGAHAIQADLTPALAASFTGSEAVFVMLPSNPYAEDFAAEQAMWGASIVEALRVSEVERIVALSSLGADRLDAPGVIGCLAEQEERLRTSTDRSLHLLRPVSFFENLLPAAQQLTDSGTHVDSVDPHLPIPMIATSDIADAAVRALTDSPWDGVRTQVLLGERDLSYAEATAILGDRLAITEARYERLPYEAMADVLVSIGFSRSYAQLYADMTRAFNTEELTRDVRRSPDNSTEISFEEFADSIPAPAAVS
ncbi:NAD(P)H-binding protein [Rhodococcus ruber]|uniref:NAD(P)H-binding protein n=1 Tax=Rhodococcus ruber TaxID=1830 RepID=A0ABT4MQ68_9NOCA|nr:NAD(P)H-binding protein [Rhodococcus ruber]MCZ4521866.1 NAD(P)H-binding protein [Rhodococcus ruber]